MEKQIKHIDIPYSLEWMYNGEISKIKKDIEELEKLGATHVDITTHYEYGDTFIEINACIKRLENDKEFTERQEKIKEKNCKIEQDEKNLFMYLKSKYEK
jgi:hypothetical protein